MHFSLTALLSLIETYKYVVLFPLAVFEGPIVTVMSGFLISIGYLDGVTAYILILIADTIGDGLHYWIGSLLRHQKASWILRFLRVDQKKLELIEAHFIAHPKKSIIFGKLAHGIGGIIQVVAGIARMPFWQFMWFSFLGTLPKSLILLFVGYTFGKYLSQIDNYLSIGGIVLFSLTILTIISYIVFSKFIGKRAV